MPDDLPKEPATEPTPELVGEPVAQEVTLAEPEPASAQGSGEAQPVPTPEPTPNSAPVPFDSAQGKPPPVQAAPPPTPPPFTNFTTRAREMLIKARATIQSKKRKKLDKILVLLDEKKNIGNDDVEKLLHVSDATATRYLNQLEREGTIIQVGKTGQSVRYVKMI